MRRPVNLRGRVGLGRRLRSRGGDRFLALCLGIARATGNLLLLIGRFRFRNIPVLDMQFRVNRRELQPGSLVRNRLAHVEFGEGQVVRLGDMCASCSEPARQVSTFIAIPVGPPVLVLG